MALPSNGKLSKDWTVEYDVMKEMQEDRMHYHAALQCHDRCVNNYWTNSLVFFEKTCMENCLSKHAQAGFVTNLNYNKFDEIETKKMKAGKK
jgi:hypothetical protein